MFSFLLNFYLALLEKFGMKSLFFFGKLFLRKYSLSGVCLFLRGSNCQSISRSLSNLIITVKLF